MGFGFLCFEILSRNKSVSSTKYSFLLMTMLADVPVNRIVGVIYHETTGWFIMKQQNNNQTLTSPTLRFPRDNLMNESDIYGIHDAIQKLIKVSKRSLKHFLCW